MPTSDKRLTFHHRKRTGTGRFVQYRSSHLLYPSPLSRELILCSVMFSGPEVNTFRPCRRRPFTPAAGAAAGAGSFLATSASVVRMIAAMEAAFCNAAGDLGRVDDAGLDHVAVLFALAASKP